MSVALLTSAAGADLADLDEPTLVARAVASDSDAIGEIYRRHQKDVHCILNHLLRDFPADVDDVASQVFVTVLEQIPGYQDRGRPFRSWLRTLIRFKAMEHRRWRTSRREDELAAPSTASADLMAQRSLDPENEAILHLELQRMLRSLSARRRLALILRDWAGWSYDDIARALNTSRRNADAAITQARRTVREAALGHQARERYPSRPARPASQGSSQDRVLAEIEAAGSTGITRNVLRKRIGLPAAQLADIVDLLTQRRLISVTQEPTLPCPTSRYRALASAERAA